LDLFSTTFSGRFSPGFTLLTGKYGLIPAIWGTFMVIIVAMAIAVPVSLAIAIFSSEFRLGFLGRAMGWILGILAGIPPIIYALMSAVFAEAFMIPKFCRDAKVLPTDLVPAHMTWYNAGTLPTEDSTLLGGIMLALLVIPFMAPLTYDALRNVPKEFKEASLALGAGRWHTLWKVGIPAALAGIVSAITLGTLKALGDVLIVGLVIGFESGMPNPLVDVFERIAPLSSTGAGLAGGFTSGGGPSCSGHQCSVAYFTGLLLLVLAVAIMLAATVLQRRLRKRFAT
jgi:phosphate transport system permease protein